MSYSIASIWAATAHPALELPVLKGDQSADVAIIGAGFTGLSAALALAEGGASVIVIDRQEPGFGASGRNGGQVIPGLKYDPDALDRMYGEATTAFAGRTADTAFSLIAKYGIDCDARRDGWIQATVKAAHLPAVEARMRQWQARGAPVEMLSATGMRQKTGSDIFVGGWLDRRAGRLHPLNYVQGLARAAVGKGVQVFARSEAVTLKRSGADWQVGIAGGGSIRAAHVIVATNGYSGPLWPALKASVVPASSFQVATAPLPGALLAEILPEGSPVSDTRRVGNYFRIGPGNRLMLGGRGHFGEAPTEADYAGVVQALHRNYPQVRALPIEFRWAGRVAMTADHLPHVHRPFDNLTMAVGYNGRGVALASALGTAIGENILDAAKRLPLRFTDIKPLPLHGLHPVYATMAIWYYKLRDALER
jgi:glycine/D-amino acid oxidase-like deaminating enzyme